MTTLKELRREVEAYLKASGMKPSNFGLAAMSDPAFVPRLKEGRDFRLSTVEKVRDWMAKNPPGRETAA